MNNFFKLAAIYGGTILLGLGLIQGCNMFWNNRDFQSLSHRTISHATFYLGHNECTKYADGQMSGKHYPGLGHRYFWSELYQDENGDGLTDKIRVNGPEWMFNKIWDVKAREQDFDSNKRQFENADKFIQNCIELLEK